MTDEEIKEVLEWVNGGITQEPSPYDPSFWKGAMDGWIRVKPLDVDFETTGDWKFHSTDTVSKDDLPEKSIEGVLKNPKLRNFSKFQASHYSVEVEAVEFVEFFDDQYHIEIYGTYVTHND